MENKTNLKGVSISSPRKKYLETEVVKRVKNNLTRKYFPVRNYSERDDVLVSFSKIGINSITNKEWWVEMPGESFWVYQSIPGDYADSIEDSELKGIIEIIKKNIPIHHILQRNTVGAIAEALALAGFMSGNNSKFVIFCGININFEVYGTGLFNYVREEPRHQIGKFNGVPVFVIHHMDPNEILVVDADNIGDFVIKKDISANLTEIDDRESIKRSLPELTDTDLNNRVRVYIEEVIAFRISNPNRSILIKLNKEE